MQRQLVGYVRVSSTAGREDERFQSPQLQRKALETWADRLDDDVVWVNWFEDLDVTGLTQVRPGLNAAKRCALDHNADIVVYDISRWSRTVGDGLGDLAELSAKGINVFSATEDFQSDSAAGAMTLQMFLVIAEWYAANRGESWRGVIASNRQRGLWHGVVPYGYRRPTPKEAQKLGRTSGVIVPDTEAAVNVRWAFEQYVTGRSSYEVGGELVRRGVYRRRSSATAMLRNPVYAGFVRFRPERRKRVGKAEGYEGKTITDSHGRPRWDYVGEENLIEGAHEPIISMDLWERAERVRAAEVEGPATRAKRTKKGPAWWGATIVRCGSCGRALGREEKPSGIYIRCGRSRDVCPGVGSVRVEELAAQVHEGLTELVGDLEVKAAERAKRATKSKDGHKRTQLRRRVREAQENMSKAFVEALKSNLPEAVREQALDELRRDLEAAEAQLAALGDPVVNAAAVSAVADQAGSVEQLWPVMTDDERRFSLRALRAQVVVDAVAPGERRVPIDGRVRLRVPW